MLRRTLAGAYTRHSIAVRATQSNLSILDQRLAQVAGCVRVLMRDRQFISLLKQLGYSGIPRHIYDCLR